MTLCADEKVIDWEKIISLYNSIKSVYALCEETDPDLYTNLQPLNEFRAALDHLMRIVAIQNLEEYKSKDIVDESHKLTSHLRRAFFDICDMLSINYRNKIIDILQKYTVECIQTVLPDYYSNIKPRIEEMSEEIAILRTNKRFDKTNESTVVDEYYKIIEELKEIYKKILLAESSLNEIHVKTKTTNVLKNWVIPIGGIIVGAIVGIIGWFIGKI